MTSCRDRASSVARHPTGTWSALNYESIYMVEQMMFIAIQDIREKWATESDELTLETLTREKFLEDLSRADEDSEFRDKFNEQLGPLVRAVINAAFAPPEGGGAQ